MSLSNPLDLPLITDAQNAKHVTHNDAILKLSQALGNMFDVDLSSADVTITNDTAQRNKFFLVSGASVVGRQLTFPLLNRSYIVRSLASNAENFDVDIDGGTSPIVFTPGSTSLVITREDGFIAAFFLATTSAVSNFNDLGDVPANYAGAASFIVRVNAAATALEFLDPATLLADVPESVDDLIDVDTTGIVAGDVLIWDGTAFLPGAQTGGGAAALNDLTDVSAAAPNDGDLLAWNVSLATWETVPPPSGGSGSWDGTVTVATKTADYTLVLGDEGALILLQDSGALTLTVPDNATQAFPVGAQISIVRNGAGAVSIAPGAGVTINTPETLILRKQYSAATLTKVATDTWHLIGDLEEVV